MDNRGSAYSAKKKRGWPPGGCRALVGGKGVTPHIFSLRLLPRCVKMGRVKKLRAEKLK